MVERSADWIKQAKRDLEMAKNARGSGFYEWACFIAQQAAEKGVKAVYQAKAVLPLVMESDFCYGD